MHLEDAAPQLPDPHVRVAVEDHVGRIQVDPDGGRSDLVHELPGFPGTQHELVPHILDANAGSTAFRFGREVAQGVAEVVPGRPVGTRRIERSGMQEEGVHAQDLGYFKSPLQNGHTLRPFFRGGR